MFCTKCGKNIDDFSKFCAVCGTPVNAAESPAAQYQQYPNQTDVLLAVHLKAGMLKKEPGIMWIGPIKSAMITIDSQEYQHIISAAGMQAPQAVKEEAFRNYAVSLATETQERVVQTHPGSTCFDTASIQGLQIIATFNPDLRRYDDYERFILDTPAGKFRGAFEKGTKLNLTEPILRTWLGYRYSYKTMEGFPFV